MAAAHALVCVNGDCNEQTLNALQLSDFQLIMAVDGGLRHLDTLGSHCDWLIGDMDSVDVKLMARYRQAGMRLVQHPSEKDATDFELALRHLVSLRYINKITLIGLSGGRLDHALANLLLLGKQDWPFQIQFRTGDGNGHLITPGFAFHGEFAAATELSLLPLSAQVTGLSCAGLYYPLENASVALGSTRGISNIVLEREVSVSLKSGRLLLLYEPENLRNSF